MKWNTNKILSDLNDILKDDNVTITTEQDPEGGYYCRDIFVIKKEDEEDEDRDGIRIIGFNTEDISDVDTPNEDIEQVEVRNFHSDSEGGIQTRDKKLRNIYYKIHDYFADENIDVVNQLKDYF